MQKRAWAKAAAGAHPDIVASEYQGMATVMTAAVVNSTAAVDVLRGPEA